jgi:hypothetical protein
MTSGISTASTTLLLALASAASPSLSRAAPEAGIDAKAIVATLKRDAPAKTAFAEVRFSGLLERPLILHGELEYDGPAALARRVESPYVERMTVANGEASVQRGDGPARKFSLGQAPELEAFLRGFAALLGGDASALDRDFTATASGNAASWRLTLKPRDARLSRRIASIDVDGSDKGARCFRTSEADGDVNVMLVESLASAKIPVRPTPPMIDALCRGIAP